MKQFFLIFTIGISSVLLFAQQSAPRPATASASALPRTPKLVVGIVVDQMRYDYIYRYWDKFGNDGFKRLVNDGFFCRNTHYNYMPTETGPGHASIYTGTSPSTHGIVANEMVDRASGKDTVYCVHDATAQNVGGTSDEGKRSPRRMLSTTIGDQLRMNTVQRSKVIGIALKDRAAILPAGHLADTARGTSAYWYESATGNFITSNYYMKTLPNWVAAFNARQLPAQYMSQPWTLQRPLADYTESQPDDNAYERIFPEEQRPVFPHPVNKITGAERYSALRRTPSGCTITKEFAVAAMQGEQLGKRGVTDLLAVSFSSPDIIGHAYGPMSVEVEDTYLRLDRDIAELLRFIDSWVGKNNALVFLTADHGAVEVPQYLADNHIPAGYFSDKVAADSIRKNFGRVYGDTSLLLTVSNYQVFLRRDRVAARKLNAADVERTAAEVLLRMDGIVGAVTATDLRATEFTQGTRSLIQNGWHPKRSGDVCYIPAPGWLAGWSSKQGTSHGSPWSYDTHVPLLWWGWKVKAGQSDVHVNITDIAPTVCQLIGIQAPNGTSGRPIEGLIR